MRVTPATKVFRSAVSTTTRSLRASAGSAASSAFHATVRVAESDGLKRCSVVATGDVVNQESSVAVVLGLPLHVDSGHANLPRAAGDDRDRDRGDPGEIVGSDLEVLPAIHQPPGGL